MTPYLLLLPAAFLYAVFIVYPIFRQFDISFYNWHIFPGISNPFVGFANYTKFLDDPRSARRRSTRCSLPSSPCRFRWSRLIAAALLTDRLPGRGLWRGLISFPSSPPGWSLVTSSHISSLSKVDSRMPCFRFSLGTQCESTGWHRPGPAMP